MFPTAEDQCRGVTVDPGGTHQAVCAQLMCDLFAGGLIIQDLAGMTGLCSGQHEHFLFFRSETSTLPHFHLPAMGQVIKSVNDYEINRRHAHCGIYKWLHLISNNWIVLAPGQSISGQRQQDNDFSVVVCPVCARRHWGLWNLGWGAAEDGAGAGGGSGPVMGQELHSQVPLLPWCNDHLQEQ